MALTDDFMQQDLHKVINEITIISNCKFMLQMAEHEEDYVKARIASENISRSYKTLAQLNDKKRHYEGMKRLANDLGIEKLELIRKWS